MRIKLRKNDEEWLFYIKFSEEQIYSLILYNKKNEKK